LKRPLILRGDGEASSRLSRQTYRHKQSIAPRDFYHGLAVRLTGCLSLSYAVVIVYDGDGGGSFWAILVSIFRNTRKSDKPHFQARSVLQ
jgi:hypothetical protein